MTAVMDPLAPPSTDKRWRIVEATIRRNGERPSALIETLHTVQECFGFLDEAALGYIARRLHTPLSRAYGVATFYHFFTMKPPGKHTCVVCMGTACYIKGAAQLLKDVKDRFAVEPGQTTTDGSLSLVTARCLGSCGLAPAVVFDGEVAGKVSAPAARERLERLVKS